MSSEVKINMKSQSALVTVAMLSAFASKRTVDYLSIISPFVLSLLPKESDVQIDIEEIAKKMSTEFGFEQFPIHVVKAILNRSAKNKYRYVKGVKGTYWTREPVETKYFEESRLKISGALDRVIDALCDYLREHQFKREVSPSIANELLMGFLENQGLAMTAAPFSLNTLTHKDLELFLVARFVIDAERGGLELYHDIEEVVRGFLVYKAVYYYSRGKKREIASRIGRVTVYFDTPLLIEAAALNTIEGNKAAQELITMIEESGGRVYASHHMVEEARGILRKYAKDEKARHTMSLKTLNDCQFSETDTLRLVNSLDAILRKNHVQVEDPPERLQPIPPLLREEIERTIGRNGMTARAMNDCDSISLVLAKRKVTNTIEHCGALLVTTNEVLVTATKEHLCKNNELTPVIRDVDLASLLWLRSYDKKSDLPRHILMQNAYAATQPTVELMDEFNRQVDKIQVTGDITEEEAILARTHPLPIRALAEITHNNPANLDKKITKEVFEIFRDSVRSGAREDEAADIKKRAYEAAEDVAQRSKVACKKFLSLMTRALCLLVVAYVVLAYLREGVHQLGARDFASATLVLVSVISFFDMFNKKQRGVNLGIDYLAEKWYRRKHSDEVNRIKGFLESD